MVDCRADCMPICVGVARTRAHAERDTCTHTRRARDATASHRSSYATMPITLQLPSQSMISNQSPANQFPADLTNLPLISRSSPTSPTDLHKSPIDLRPQTRGAQWTLLGTQWQQSPIDLPPISYQPSCLSQISHRSPQCPANLRDIKGCQRRTCRVEMAGWGAGRGCGLGMQGGGAGKGCGL